MPRKYEKTPVTPRNRTVPPVRTEAFKAHQFDAAPDVSPEVKLARNAVCVNLPEEDDRHVREQPNKTAWLRAAVREKIERDGGTEDETDQNSNRIGLEQLQEHINAVLLSIRPRERAESARLFRKLLDRVES